MGEKKILLIDDDDFLRELYKDLLTGNGYTVETAADGQTGLEKVKQGNWDLVLTDMVLPGITGIAIAQQALQESETKPFKHLVFLTNLYNDAQEKEALKLGDEYLVKIQLTPEAFLGKVKKYLTP